MKRIMIDKELCSSCLNCYVACAAEHNDSGKSLLDVDLENIKSEGRNHIAIDSTGKPVPIFCRHCDEPECVNTCMSGAMTKNKETGVVSYDKEKCASCFMCVISCPFGVLKPDTATKKTVVKCDLCGDRETPRCVENCPTGAIYVQEVNA